MRRNRIATLVLGAVVGLGGLSACGDDGQGSDHGNDVAGGSVSPAVLTAKEVGASSKADLDRYLGSIGTCGPDDSNLVGGQNSRNTVAYRRGDGSQGDLVLVSVSKRPRTMVEAGMKQVRRALTPGACTTDPPTTVRALSGQPNGVVAFGSRFTDDHQRPASVIRSYYYISSSQRLVMVSLMRVGGGDPSTKVLYDLTAAQISKARGDA